MQDRIVREVRISTQSFGQSSRLVPSDALFGWQWHLLNTGQTGGMAGIDLNVTGVWDDYTGTGVVIGVYDDGVDYLHGDLNDTYDPSRHLVIGGVVQDALPASTASADLGGDTHGTAVAGLIAAENNGAGVVGVSFGATIAGVPLLRSSNPANTVAAMQQQSNFDVVNHSWGFVTPFAADRLSSDPGWQAFFASLADAAGEGRGGLGTIIVHAAGNEREEGRETNYDNFSNSRFVVAVGAVDHRGEITYYSSPGASVLVSAPSGGGGAGITTTDLAGSSGDSVNDYRSDFGGTSAAAPLVSGVVALMLESNPELGWRDVQEILVYSARHVGSDIGDQPSGYEWYRWSFNGAADWNGGGLHFSNDYGFGLVDAHAAVRLAETWLADGTSGTEQSATVSASPGAGIPDNSLIGVVTNLNLTSNLRIEHVELLVDIDHTARGDLKITLTSPDGTVSTLLDRPLNGSDSGNDLVFTLASNAFWGEASLGLWTVKVTDEAAIDNGVVQSLTLRVYGETVTADSVFIYTDEFSTFGGLSGRAELVDQTGLDTVNASAVTSASILDLRSGASMVIAGRSVAIGSQTIIENAVGGDGSDTLIGNSAVNRLAGGRGDDVYVIDGSSDTTLELSDQGTDEIQTALGIGNSVQSRRAAMYQLTAANVEILTGTSDLGQGLRGNAGDNIVNGAGGDDYIDLTDGGSDIVNSGDGRDVLYYGGALSGGDANDAGDEGGDPRGDLIVIQGDYSAGLTLGADALIDIEKFRVLKADNTSFGHDGTGSFSYLLTTVDANVAAGGLLVIQGGSLQVGETLIFDGSAESDGRFQIFGGRDGDTLEGGSGDDHLLGRAGDDHLIGNGGNDRLRGGTGSDLLEGGEGADTFIYAALPHHATEPYTVAALESTSLDYDTILGFDFGEDRIDLPQAVSALEELGSGSLSTASFDADLAAALDGILDPSSAVLFTADAGDLAGNLFLVVDADGDGVCTAGADFVFCLDDPVGAQPTAPFFFV